MKLGSRPATFLLTALIVLAAGPSRPIAQPHADAAQRITITATPIRSFSRSEPDRRRFGRLEFLGGLVLASDAERFGGLSALSLDPDGKSLLALSDRAMWVRGRMVTDGDQPVGIADAELAPVLGSDGKPLAATNWYDTEALARDGGTLYVGIERVHRIVRFEYGTHGLAARAHAISVPPGMRELPNNQGIESLVFIPRGLPLGTTLIAISERGLDADGNIRGFLIGGRSPGTFSVRRSGEFDITDAALTPDGNLLILERHFSFTRGIGMRVRSIALADVKPGALLDGNVLIEAGNANEIDNMEALAVHRNAAGQTILTILSDDNLRPLQRTLLLRFALIEED